jgi:hypothetical protein
MTHHLGFFVSRFWNSRDLPRTVNRNTPLWFQKKLMIKKQPHAFAGFFPARPGFRAGLPRGGRTVPIHPIGIYRTPSEE